MKHKTTFRSFFFILLLVSITGFQSCSSSDDSDDDDTPDFAMTAKINGIDFMANNPFGTNEFSNTNIFNYYPIEDFVLIQGRQGGILGNPEINIWLKRSDIVVGTYSIEEETFETPPSHFIDLIDNSNSIFENTKEGTITITEVNSSTNMVRGTFEFTTVQELENPAAPIDFNVTEGEFYYVYQ